MNSPRIVILIPTYNNVATILKTLESLVSQGNSLSQIETVYIADDCSTDNTILVAKSYWKSSTPLIVFKNEKNLGQWTNVNHAFDSLPNNIDWILILHSDDIAKENWLNSIIQRINNCPENVASICSSWDNLHSNGLITVGEDDPNKAIQLIIGHKNSVKDTLLKGCWWHISGCAIKLETFKFIGAFNADFPQVSDWEFLLRLLDSGRSVEYIPRTLILYRQHQLSVSSASFKKNKDIFERLHILQNYILLLSLDEIFKLHIKNELFTIRRILKSCIKGDLIRLTSSVHAFISVFLNFGLCLYLKNIQT